MRVMNCEKATNYLIDKITESLDIVAPIETKTFNEKHDNDWITPGISTSLAQKARLYKKHKASATNPTLKNKYRTYKNLLDKVIREAKAMSTEQELVDSENDTRKIWGILNKVVDRKQLKHRIPERFNINGRCVTDAQEIANAFNSYFASIGSQMADTIPTREGYKTYVKQSYGLSLIHI